jgi:redox-sensing transcriptional repressor
MIIKSNVKRLLQYRLCLVKFKELGFTKIYSYNLGNEAGVSPEQVRKDFSIHGITGNKKAGYDIETLLNVFNNIFGMDEIHNVLIVGMGNMGRALANYNNQFIGQNVYVISTFDIDPAKINKKGGIPVYPMDLMDEHIKRYNISTAIITVPGIAAQEVCNKLIASGIKGILNFTPVILKVPDDVIINNINLSTEIQVILYYLSKQNNTLDF